MALGATLLMAALTSSGAWPDGSMPEFNPDFPACVPRFVQFAIWRLCSTSELDVCNGNRIDDRGRFQNAICPMFPECDRVALCPE
jgi:hypothetical protein